MARVEPDIIFTEAGTAHLFETCTQTMIAGRPFDGADHVAHSARTDFAGSTPGWPDVVPEDINGIKFNRWYNPVHPRRSSRAFDAL